MELYGIVGDILFSTQGEKTEYHVAGRDANGC